MLFRSVVQFQSVSKIIDFEIINGLKESDNSYIYKVRYTMISDTGQKAAILEQVRSFKTDNGWQLDLEYSADGHFYGSDYHIDEERNSAFEEYNKGHTCLHDKITTPDSRYELLNAGAEVRDTMTNLVWQRCRLGQHWNGSDCTGVAVKYTWQKIGRAHV